MLSSSKGFGKSFFLGLALFTPTLGLAQLTFSYNASDYRTFAVNEPGFISIPVRTVIVIQGPIGSDVEFATPTRSFTVTIRPPQIPEARLTMAHVDGRVVDLHIVRTNGDGEYEATVILPMALGLNPEIKIDWSSKDSGRLETTVAAIPVEMPVLYHGFFRPQKSTTKRMTAI